MTGGTAVILGDVGDNFGAGMTGGMAFVYDPKNKFENYVNPFSITWQKVETDFWKNELKKLINEFVIQTESIIGKQIIRNFDNEIINFQ